MSKIQEASSRSHDQALSAHIDYDSQKLHCNGIVCCPAWLRRHASEADRSSRKADALVRHLPGRFYSTSAMGRSDIGERIDAAAGQEAGHFRCRHPQLRFFEPHNARQASGAIAFDVRFTAGVSLSVAASVDAARKPTVRA